MPDLAQFVYLALAAVGLAYAVGLAGIPSLGQGAFLGIGAFAEALAARRRPAGRSCPRSSLAVAMTTVVGVLTGLATGRLRSAFVAVSTWILSWILLLLLTSFPGLSGGAQGLVLPEATVFGRTLTPTAHYVLGITLLALAVLALAVIARAGAGPRTRAPRATSGARRRRSASRSRGYGSGVFAASAVIAGVAGALGVELVQVADASSYGPALSFKLFVAVILGGARAPARADRRPAR